MKLEKFNLPAEVTHMISTLEPEHQGIVYCHLFAYIYDGIAVPDDIEPRCRLIITMILRMIDKDLQQAHVARNRRAYRPSDRKEDRKFKFWPKHAGLRANIERPRVTYDRDRDLIAAATKKFSPAHKFAAKIAARRANAPGSLPADRASHKRRAAAV